MRGPVDLHGELFHTFNLEEIIPSTHPLRATKSRVDRILKDMSGRFTAAYSKSGRHSVPPERLIKALLLQALYSIRSEIQLCEQIGYNMLFRWFLDLSPSDGVWTPEVFSMNRKRFDEHHLVRDFFDRIVADAVLEGLVSEEHFSVDGTLIQSFASIKSLRPLDSTDQKVSDGSEDDDPGNPTVNFRGEKRNNQTHRSIVDREALLARKGQGKPALLCHSAHVLMENRNGLCMDFETDDADGHSERRQAQVMIKRTRRRHSLRPGTLGSDGGYRDGKFLSDVERLGIVPHVPVPDGPIRGEGPAAEARRRARRRSTTKGYAISQRVRKRIEELIGWCKTIGGLARARFVGRWKIKQQGQITAAAYNLLRMARLVPEI